MKRFIESQFGYCPLVWTFHGRIVKKKINHLHEGSYELFIKIILVFFEDLLKKR